MQELAAASTGTARPWQQCARAPVLVAYCAPVLVAARLHHPRDLRRLPPLSLTPFVAGRRSRELRRALDPRLGLAYI